MERILEFPDKFFWGSSTSSYQVEGGIDNCNWSKTFPAGIACDHYSRYEEDFDLLKSLGQNAYRFSIEWSRIEPEEGKFDEKEIKHYQDIIFSLRRRQIEPFVTIWHWTHPIWLEKKGGIISNQFPYYFSRYSEKISSALGKDVKFWITINEPEIFSSSAYLTGQWPPKKKNFIYFLFAINNLVKSHREAYKVIKKINPSAQVGIATNNTYYEASSDFVSKILKKIAESLDHFYILDKISKYQDFIGLNYYFHNKIKWFLFNQNENKTVSDLGWEIYPEGIYHVLNNLKKYKKPIYITENGLADKDDKFRKCFIEDHLSWIHKAISEGIDVRGYLHWSLMDNLEWHKGFEPEFGLVNIEREALKRVPRPSAYYYAEICKTNQLKI